MQYFGSNIVEGVAESWMEAEMSWVEVDGAGWSWVELGARFSNTLYFLRYAHVSYVKSLFTNIQNQ